MKKSLHGAQPDGQSFWPARLSLPYISVEGSYGGSQMWAKEKSVLQTDGCGLVSVTDICLHLLKTRQKAVSYLSKGEEEKAQYVEVLKQMRQKYFPVLKGIGVPGPLLASGINRFFLSEGLPYKASWHVTSRDLFEKISQMLAKDLPVCFSVGPGIGEGVRMYESFSQTEQGWDLSGNSRSIKGHYMTITALLGSREAPVMEISSWGRKYYMDFTEYLRYAKRHSTTLFSNILYIKKTGEDA